MTTFLRSINQFIAFDGDGSSGDGSGSDGDGSGGDGSGSGEDGSGSGERTFTQKQVNTFLAEEKRKNQAQQRKMAADLEQLKKTATLTVEEKEGLEKRIEELQSQYMTAEEKARRAEEAAEKKHGEQVDTLIKERDTWKSKHSRLVIDTAITQAALEGNERAYHPEQIIAILGSKTKLVEKLDEDGQPTGDYEPKVSFDDIDKQGKPVILEFTPLEAVKRMRELPKYGNLFVGDKKGGLGGTGSAASSSGGPDIAKIAREDPAGYRKLRKEKPELFSR